MKYTLTVKSLDGRLSSVVWVTSPLWAGEELHLAPGHTVHISPGTHWVPEGPARGYVGDRARVVLGKALIWGDVAPDYGADDVFIIEAVHAESGETRTGVLHRYAMGRLFGEAARSGEPWRFAVKWEVESPLFEGEFLDAFDED